MQFVRFRRDGGPARWGYREGDVLHQLDDRLGGDPTLEALAVPSVRETIARQADRGEFATVPEAAVTRLAPVARPGKIVALGLNYYDHAEESGGEPPEAPLLFSKAPTSVTRPGAPIVHPDAVDQVDYEVELGVVVGRTARSVDAADAADYVAGYTVGNDVSARDAQFSDDQWFRGKSFDTFAPMGPRLVAGDGFDPTAVAVELRVNGETKQHSNTSELIFDPAEVIAYASDVMTLEPGDVIATGTPAGVGVFRDPPELLDPGDTVEAEVEGIGTLVNHVVAE
jgi:2-keto-4-pentenoate hydratase/2-oxohepta-3-ene-1,7-dioic acid hydratase in catechol pathway